MSRRILTALPVFNEEKHVLDVLAEVRRYSQDVLVVDDGSSDRTPELLSRQTDLRVITHERNSGYGAALRTAFLAAVEEEYDVLVTIDCDGQHEPRLIPELAAALDAPVPLDAPIPNGKPGERVDIVSGSRYLKRFEGDSLPPEERRRINVEITRLVNERLGFQLTDAFCGFKAYRVDCLDRFDINELGYAMPLQVWVQAAAAKLKIVEFPVPLVYLEEFRSFGGSLDKSEIRRKYYLDLFEREYDKAFRQTEKKPTTCGQEA